MLRVGQAAKRKRKNEAHERKDDKTQGTTKGWSSLENLRRPSGGEKTSGEKGRTLCEIENPVKMEIRKIMTSAGSKEKRNVR